MPQVRAPGLGANLGEETHAPVHPESLSPDRAPSTPIQFPPPRFPEMPGALGFASRVWTLTWARGHRSWSSVSPLAVLPQSLVTHVLDLALAKSHPDRVRLLRIASIFFNFNLRRFRSEAGPNLPESGFEATARS